MKMVIKDLASLGGTDGEKLNNLCSGVVINHVEACQNLKRKPSQSKVDKDPSRK